MFHSLFFLIAKQYIPIKLATSKEDILEYCRMYEKHSGLPLPEDYALNSQVYLAKDENGIFAGFILSDENQHRSIDLFVASENKAIVQKEIDNDGYLDICCTLFLRKRYPKPIHSLIYWTLIAYYVRKSKKEVILFGTALKGHLRKLSALKHTTILANNKVQIGDQVKRAWLISTYRRTFFKGVLRVTLTRVLFLDYRISKDVFSKLRASYMKPFILVPNK